MTNTSMRTIINGAVDDILASRHHQQSIDLEYRHNPETINIIVADELAALQQRRAAHQHTIDQEITP